MKIKVFTLFPEMLRPMLSQSILGRAIRNGLIEVSLIDIRDYTQDKHRSTDDYPFGGGAGMVMTAQPIVDAMTQNLGDDFRGKRIYLSPRGPRLNQRKVEALARENTLALLCGHYEGVDQRALDSVIDEELSIGDFVLTGGELGALVVIDAVARLVPGVLGSDESSADESFTTGLLEYPQYTRPADFRGMKVPEVLLGGNHADITAWRREQSLQLTLERRPELLDAAPLTDADRALLHRLKRARALNLPGERLEMRLADAFPRRWFLAFVPEARRKEAKKVCLSGRRHIGHLWQAFAGGFAGSVNGEAALSLWRERAPESVLLYLPDEGLLYRTRPDIAPPEGEYVLADEAMTVTFTHTPDGRQFCCAAPETSIEA